MKSWLFALVLSAFFGGATAQVSQYEVNVGPFTQVSNFAPPCPDGQSCANFADFMGHSGSFTVASPLAPNLSGLDITADVRSFSFSDGVNTFSSANTNDILSEVFVSTDAQGQVVEAYIFLGKWLSGTNGAHVAGDRISFFILARESFLNVLCTEVDVSPLNVAETCVNAVASTSSTWGIFDSVTPVWNVRTQNTAVVSVPTMSQWAMITMTLLMAAVASVKTGRRNEPLLARKKHS